MDSLYTNRDRYLNYLSIHLLCIYLLNAVRVYIAQSSGRPQIISSLIIQEINRQRYKKLKKVYCTPGQIYPQLVELRLAELAEMAEVAEIYRNGRSGRIINISSTNEIAVAIIMHFNIYFLLFVQFGQLYRSTRRVSASRSTTYLGQTQMITSFLSYFVIRLAVVKPI